MGCGKIFENGNDPFPVPSPLEGKGTCEAEGRDEIS
jgi:hypothetical protein